MNARERAITKHLFDLQVELLGRHGVEIQAMKAALASLERTQAIIGKMVEQVSALINESEDE